MSKIIFVFIFVFVAIIVFPFKETNWKRVVYSIYSLSIALAIAISAFI